jgi:hypothetical protein
VLKSAAKAALSINTAAADFERILLAVYGIKILQSIMIGEFFCRNVLHINLPDAVSYGGTASSAPYYQRLSRAKYLCCYPDETVSVIDLAAKTERKIDGCEWHTDTDGMYGALGGEFYFSRNGGSLDRMGFLDCGSEKLTVVDRTPAAEAAMQEWNSPECFDTGVFVLGVGDMLKPQYILVYDFCPD